ncbi:MAG: carbohydrate binding domain-containing protein [Vicinamibacteria bacterium]
MVPTSRTRIVAGTAVPALAAALALAPALGWGASTPGARGGSLAVEDFESYETDAALAKAWYVPPHGNWMRQTLVPRPGGGHAMRFEYRTSPGEGKYYAAICIVKSWDLGGFDAIRFWLRPDGSGRELTVQLNLADAKGSNIHDLWQASWRPAKGDRSPQVVTIPFARLEHPAWLDRTGKRPTFGPAAVNEIALYVGAPEGPYGEGAYEFDDFAAVRVQDDLAARALAAMEAKAKELKAEGVAVVAWTDAASPRAWSSRMAVVGRLTAPPDTGAPAGANLLAIAYAKACEMAVSGKDSGHAGRAPMLGELGWTGGVVGSAEGGKLVAAFSGGPSEDDVKISRAGLDVLSGGGVPE